MSIIDFHALKNAYPDGNMAEAAKTLQALDPYHCLIAATPKTTAKITKMASSLPQDFLKWIEVCDGGLLFSTTLFCTETYKSKLTVPLDTYNRVNNTKSKEKTGLSSECFIFAESIGNDYFFFDTAKNDGKVYECYGSTITGTFNSFEQWLFNQLDLIKQAVKNGTAEPLGLKLLFLEKNNEKEPIKPFNNITNLPASVFWEKAEIMQSDKLYELDEYYFNNFTVLSSKFKEYFKQSCEAIIKLQNATQLDEVGYIEYAFKPNDILSKNYTTETWVYDKDFYAGNVKISTGCFFDISKIFTFFEDFCNDLNILKNSSSWSIDDKKYKSYIMKTMDSFYDYIVALANDTILDCIDKIYFTAIKKHSVFEIWAGELNEPRKMPILKINSKKNKKNILKMIKNSGGQDFKRFDFSGVNFSGEDFSNSDFWFTDFRFTLMENVSFKNGNLNGSWFIGSNLANANFHIASLEGVIFDNAILSNADFSHSFSYKGSKTLKEEGNTWLGVGSFPLSFRNSDLRGANFIGAELEEADFSGAILDGANFNRDWWESRLDLTPEQLSTIIFVDNKFSEFVKKE